MKTINYYTPNGINLALSNLMPACNRGHETAAAEVKDIIEANELDAGTLCEILNKHDWTCDEFEPYRPLDNGCIIKVTDFCGNMSFLKITY